MPFHVYEGSGDPGFTPRAAGLHYTNYTNGDIYLSNGYASSADWILIGTTASIASAITTHAALVSSVHGITAAAAAVLDDATVAAMVDTLGGAASTGTNGLVRATSPTLVTPVLGVASATSLALPNGSGGAPSIQVGSGAYVNGWYSFAGLQLNGVINGASIFGIRSVGAYVDGNFALGSSADVVLERIAANHLGLSNGANAQSLSVYNVAGTDYERGVIDWQTTANVLTIGTQKGGAGNIRAVRVVVGGTTVGTFDTSANFSAPGLITGGAVSSGDYLSGVKVWISNHVQLLTGGATGILQLLNWAGTDFNRIQFGGTSASFPATKRRNATLETRLADDSALAVHVSAYVTKAGAISDSDFTNPVDGCHGYDTTNFKHYVRSSGAWKSSAAYT